MPSIPKPDKRIVKKDFYNAVKMRDGACLWGLIRQDGWAGSLEAHHIQYRGQGGDDLPENGITLCQKHHQQVHQHAISNVELLTVMEKFKVR